MPVVKMPDGTQVRFPDDMPREQIRDMIASKFPDAVPQAESDVSRETRKALSEYTQNPAWGQYDTLPEWQKPIVAANDIVTSVADGATFGYGDKAAAWARSKMGGGDYDTELAEQRRQTRGSKNRAGWAGTAGEVTGALALPVKTGATLAGRFGTAGMTGAKGLGARTGLMAIEGGGYGGLNAAGHDEDIGQGIGLGLAAGAGGNLAGEALSAGINKVAGVFNRKPSVPTSQQWKTQADDAFAEMRKEGVIFTKQAFDDLENKLNTFLTRRAYWPDNQPGIRGGLAMMKDIKDRGGMMTPEGLLALRQRFSGGYVMGNKNNNAMVREAISLIDDLLQNPQKGFVAARGDPARAAAAYKRGMTASRNQHKLEDVEYLINKGKRQADRNIIDNSNKRVKTLLSDKLLDPKSPMSRGWNAAEREAIKKASSYGLGERTAHAMSGLAPQGNLTGMAHMATAAGTGGASIPWQIGAAGVGFASGKLADSLARKPVRELAQLIANGGIPPAQVQNLMQRLAHSKREALSRTLMALGVVSGREAIGQQ